MKMRFGISFEDQHLNMIFLHISGMSGMFSSAPCRLLAAESLEMNKKYMAAVVTRDVYTTRCGCFRK